MGQGPLSEPRLAEIESKLNAGRFDEAQRMLATIFDLPNAQAASAYFATRLLFQRGRLDRAGVVQRLRELLTRVTDFPEARRMLEAAEAGVLEPAPEIFRQVTGAPRSSAPGKEAVALGTKKLTRQDIPRAPPLPRFTPRSGTPSYVPATPRPPTPPVGGAAAEPPEESSVLFVEELKVERNRPLPRIPSLEIPSVSLPFEPPTRESPRLQLPDLEPPEFERERVEPPPLELSPPVASPRARPTLLTATLSTLPPPPESPVSPESLAARRAAVTERPEPPSSPATGGPSLFEVASALDAGHPARALELAERAAPELGPELTLLKARALVALGEKDKAIAQLERLLRAVLIEPLVRASSARLLIELGRPEQALIQARRAANDDPEDPVSRATLAWALVRVARRTGDALLGEEVEQLLSTTRLREGAIASLLLGLRAAVAAEFGDPARAVSLAQTALQQEPRQVDALAALAVASARLGLRSDAEHAQQRLEAINAEEAAITERAVARHGVRLERSAPPEAMTLAESTATWGEAETALRAGQKDPAIGALVAGCDELAQKLTRRGDVEAWPRLARSAARLFTELPLLRHFAPFDCSVFSVDRLEAALSLIFDQPQQDALETVELVLGAYVGECCRQAFGAEWQGIPSFPRSASIEGVGISTRPCDVVHARLTEGTPLVIEAPRNLHPGADPLGNSVPLSLRPPAPWDPKPWPSREQFVQLGRLLPISVVGYYCSKVLGLPLDGSVSGAAAIDRYVALLAPPKAPPDPDGAWLFRVSLLLAAYLGNVLVDAVGARWEIVEPPSAPESYRLVLPHGTVTTPVSRVLDRLAGRRAGSLSEYVTRLASGRASMTP